MMNAVFAYDVCQKETETKRDRKPRALLMSSETGRLNLHSGPSALC